MARPIGERDRVRWLTYFDLLGIRALIAEGREGRVFDAYWAAQKEFKNHSEWAPTLGHAWLSDTFLIVAPDDSSESFKRLEFMSRCFAGSLLGHQIPLRGAIACDRFFADYDERVYFGRALVEAYEYGEGQDWIGMLLCPSASARLNSLPEWERVRQYYRSVDVPLEAAATSGCCDTVGLCAGQLGSSKQSKLINRTARENVGSVQQRRRSREVLADTAVLVRRR